MTAKQATNLFMIQWQEISIQNDAVIHARLAKIRLFSPFRKHWNLYTMNIYHSRRDEENIFNSFDSRKWDWDSAPNGIPMMIFDVNMKFISSTFPQSTSERNDKSYSTSSVVQLHFPSISRLHHFKLTNDLESSRQLVCIARDECTPNLNISSKCFVQNSSTLFLPSDMTLYSRAQLKCVNFQWIFECFNYFTSPELPLDYFQNFILWSKLTRDMRVCLRTTWASAECIVCKLNICCKSLKFLYQHFVMSLAHTHTPGRSSKALQFHSRNPTTCMRYVIWSVCLWKRSHL